MALNVVNHGATLPMAALHGVGTQAPQRTGSVPADTARSHRGHDRLQKHAAPSFSVLHPMPWASHHIEQLSAPLGIDGRYAVGGLVIGEFAGQGVKLGVIARDFAKISRTKGLRVFAQEVGTKGVCKQIAKSAGKGWAASWAVMGAATVVGLAVGYVVFQANKK